MQIKSLEAIPEIRISEDTAVRMAAELALATDVTHRLHRDPLTRYEVTQALWTASKKRGANAVRLYNRVVGQPAFRAAMI